MLYVLLIHIIYAMQFDDQNNVDTHVYGMRSTVIVMIIMINTSQVETNIYS